jgi:hypothetical protein
MAKISTERDLDRWVDFLRVQVLPIEVTCEPWKAPRKLTANAYLWKLYGRLVEMTEFGSEDWHRHYCGEYFGWKEVETPSGHIDYQPVRTTTKDESGKRDVMKGEPFNKFLVEVEKDCAKRGVFIERGAL